MTDTSPRRWHAQDNVALRDSLDTIEQHQKRVAVLCHELAARLGVPTAGRDLLKAARYHDEAERVLGDMPAPAKRRFPKLAAAYAEAERQVLAEMGFSWELSEMESAILDLCDKLDAYLWAQNHGACGPEWIDAKGRIRYAAYELGLKAMRWLHEKLT